MAPLWWFWSCRKLRISQVCLFRFLPLCPLLSSCSLALDLVESSCREVVQFGCVCGTKKYRESEHLVSSRKLVFLPLSLPCLQSVFLSPSLMSLLLLSPLVNVSFRFSAFPSLILQRSHSGFRADLSKSPSEEGRRQKERKGENGGRLCLRER